MPARTSKYLRPADLTRLKRLFFTSRRPVLGQYSGTHVSALHGRGVEFTDYRQYLPGDPVTDVDWKAYARSDRLYLKLFEHQSDMAVNILADASASMAYGGADGKGPTKFDYAARLAAAIAFLACEQRDRVCFGLAREGLTGFVHTGQSPHQLDAILLALDHARPQGRARLAAAARAMIAAVPRRGLFIVMSDLLEEGDDLLAALSLFTHRGGQAILFHVLHPDELRLPDVGEAVFIDSELPAQVAASADDLREDHAARVKQFLGRWSAAGARRGIDYNLVSTATPHHRALHQYLYTRAGRG